MGSSGCLFGICGCVCSTLCQPQRGVCQASLTVSPVSTGLHRLMVLDADHTSYLRRRCLSRGRGLMWAAWLFCCAVWLTSCAVWLFSYAVWWFVFAAWLFSCAVLQSILHHTALAAWASHVACCEPCGALHVLQINGAIIHLCFLQTGQPREAAPYP